jgi:hypothetical protein
LPNKSKYALLDEAVPGNSLHMENEQKQDEIMHDFSGSKSPSFLSMKAIVILIIVLLLGVGTGYLLSSHSLASHLPSSAGGIASMVGGSSVQKGKTYGDGDLNTFKDTAEGTMKAGGIDGEGAFHLVRPGGDTQTVYLTSSLVDLSQFINHKVKVWGQTQKAQKAGWLMDVGRVEVMQ